MIEKWPSLCVWRDERSVSVVEYLVSATLTLCQAVAGDRRIMLCGLGEDIIIPLLHLWSNRPSQRLQVGHQNIPQFEAPDVPFIVKYNA